eukprot:4731983-Amphidinium_carterae.1
MRHSICERQFWQNPRHPMREVLYKPQLPHRQEGVANVLVNVAATLLIRGAHQTSFGRKHTCSFAEPLLVTGECCHTETYITFAPKSTVVCRSSRILFYLVYLH